jgi:5'-deoxynucleotidase YfbR-like HD superfamily hydrolase
MSQPTTVRGHLADRSAAAVMRWHNTLTLKTESDAEHQFFVAESASLICQLLAHYNIAWANELDAVTMARMHDKAETEVGDIVGQAKRRCPELAQVARMAEVGAATNLLFDGLPESIARYYRVLLRRALWMDEDDLEAQIVLYCDRLGAYTFACQEMHLGNSEVKRLVDACYQELQEMTWPWLVALRKAADVI